MQFFKKNIPLTFLFLEDLRPSANSILKSYCLDFGVANRGGGRFQPPYLKFSEIFFACLNCVRNPIPKRNAKRIFEIFSQKFCRVRAQTLKPFFLKRFFGQKIKINQISLLNEANLFEKELLFR